MTESPDKLSTLRAHRRVLSNPFPIPILGQDSVDADSSGSGGDSDAENESIVTTPDSASRLASTSDAEMMLGISDNSSYMESSSTIMEQMSLEIADLCHSPTLNRRSVSIFNFREELIIDDTETELSSGSKSPEMAAAALLNKIHRSFNNLTSTSSMESIEREDYRGLVLREILDTERTYLSSLDTLVSIFLPALEELASPRDLRLIFPCQLEPLIQIHQEVLAKLEERIEGISQWHGIVGDIFGRLCSDKEKEFISVYSAYMNEFKVAMQTLVKYQNTSALFCRTTENCIKKHNLDGLSLASFLLTPIQRLPRYELLLKQLMKHTPEDHPDVYYLEAALESLHSDLTMLDRSIQACQFASTVGTMNNEGGRKRSIKKQNSRRHNKRHQSSRFARIKRHFSHTSINDFPLSPRRPVSALEKSSSFAVSEYNILEKVGSFDSRPSSRLGASSVPSRAISCSEVHLLDSDKPLRGLELLSVGNSSQEGEKKDVFDEERTPCMSKSSSIVSQDSIVALSSKRESIYSTNSSNTSGFDSLTGGMLETDYDEASNHKRFDHNTLRPVQATASTSSNDSGFNNNSRDNGSSSVSNTSSGATVMSSNNNKSSSRRKSTITSAFNVIRRASKEFSNSPLTRQKSSSSSINNLSRLDISDPLDFRHIQHGFTNRPVSIAL